MIKSADQRGLRLFSVVNTQDRLTRAAGAGTTSGDFIDYLGFFCFYIAIGLGTDVIDVIPLPATRAADGACLADDVIDPVRGITFLFGGNSLKGGRSPRRVNAGPVAGIK